MTEPLTAAEWDAIHRAMDRLDRSRHAAEPQGPNEARVREAVLTAYREQGVEVDARDVDRAVKEALPKRPVVPARWVRSRSSPPALLTWGRARGWKRKTRWDGSPMPAPFVDRRNAFDWLNSKTDKWKWEVARLASHVPLDDDALWEKLANAARHQLNVRVEMGRLSAYLGGVGLFSIVVAALGLVNLLFGALGGIVVWASLVTGWRRMEAEEALGHLGEALQALKDKEWEHPSFAVCFPEVGLIHLGSLRPIAMKSREWAAAHVAAEPHKDLHATFTQWNQSRALRVNDALVMQRMAEVQDNHPLKVMYRATHAKINTWWKGVGRGL